jgi:hypothetical protein
MGRFKAYKFIYLFGLLFLGLIACTAIITNVLNYNYLIDFILNEINRKDLYAIITQKFFPESKFILVRKISIGLSLFSFVGLFYYVKRKNAIINLLEAVVKKLQSHFYNFIYEVINNSPSINKLLIISLTAISARSVFYALDFDIQFDEDENFVNIGNSAQATLFQAVVKGFSQFSVDSYFINKDIGKGEVVVMEANRKGAAKNQFNIWYNAFLRKFGDEYDVVPKTTEDISKFMNRKTQSLEDLATILKKGNNYSEDQLKTQLERIIGDMKDELGINLSPLFLKRKSTMADIARSIIAKTASNS